MELADKFVDGSSGLAHLPVAVLETRCALPTEEGQSNRRAAWQSHPAWTHPIHNFDTDALITIPFAFLPSSYC